MSQAELLAFVVGILEALRIPYIFVGSYASSYYGEPRSTHDIAMVIELDGAKISTLVRQLDPQRYFISEPALREGRMAGGLPRQIADMRAIIKNFKERLDLPYLESQAQVHGLRDELASLLVE